MKDGKQGKIFSTLSAFSTMKIWIRLEKSQSKYHIPTTIPKFTFLICSEWSSSSLWIFWDLWTTIYTQLKSLFHVSFGVRADLAKLSKTTQIGPIWADLERWLGLLRSALQRTCRNQLLGINYCSTYKKYLKKYTDWPRITQSLFRKWS